LVAIGGRVGGGLAPILTATLIVWFVSLDVSNELNSDDLLDTHYLCFRMAEAREPTNPADRVARSLFDHLSPEGQQVTRKLAETYAQKRIGTAGRQGDSKANSEEYVSAKSLGLETPSDQTVAPIVRDLNRIVGDPSGFELGDFRDIPIEREAKRLIARGPSLSSSDSDRSLGEAPRLNRLLLEAACPNSIKKIYVKGWRPVMCVFGAMGLLVASLFWFVVRDWPSRHPRCDPAEAALIDSGRPAGVPAPGGPVKAVPMKQMLKSRSLWLVCFNQFLGNIGWVFLVSWLPRYLFKVHHVPLEQRGLMAAIPLWVGWSGMLLGGWLTDRVVRQFGLRWRMSPIIVGRFLEASAYFACLFQPSAWAATIAFAVVAFSCDLGNPSSWAYKQDVGGPHVGSILGWPNMWGNLGAALCLVLHPVIVRQFGWDAAFATCACAFLISGIAVLGVDARIPIVPKDEE
jgi:nitrate/nitrite transporter NarK